MRSALFLSIYLLCCFSSSAQDTVRQIKAVRSPGKVKIDGLLDEEAWKGAAVAKDFIEQRPAFGKKENFATRTEAFIFYDDNAVYVAAICYDTRDSISTELVGRDQIGINDFAGVMFDTYLDQINGTGFYVTALGEQYDCKYSLGYEDGGWSTVYETGTSINDKGWIFEMRIPYSALRFSKEKVQTWGVNFVRRRSKTGQQYMWSPVDPNKFGLMNQAGRWEGIKDIRSPLRLSFSPYLSYYISEETSGSDWKSTFNGGMDVKYGISKGFTLDMTLIPDFGQVQSDNQVLNLSPFEVRYNENRSFFTEGTELFNKGNLFYSRRIGGVPVNRGFSLATGEKVIKNPSETKLINATKVSGRTAKGLGIGFFNAVTRAEHALIENAMGERYKIETSPLTNYNIIVLDQTLKNNSSVSLVNTNVLRKGSTYDANVTAVLWDLYDKKIDWNIWGKIGNSRLTGLTAPGELLSGFLYEINLGKFRGPFNFEVHQFMANEKYQQNDLGYFTNNNYLNTGFAAWYKWMKPKGFYNNVQVQLGGNYSQRFRPRDYQSFNLNLNVNSQLKNLWNVGISGNIRPEQQDFYEPRKSGRVFKTPGSWMTGFRFQSNGAKKYSYGLGYYVRPFNRYEGIYHEMNVNNRFRFNDKLTIGLSNYMLAGNHIAGFGYIDAATEDVIFGLRQQRTIENVFDIKYNFNIKMGLTFRARHYWSRVNYQEFFELRDDGYLDPIANAQQNPDNNVNFFNIDMVYTWQFAPGSFINIAWKDASEVFDHNMNGRYFKNLQYTFQQKQQNSFSVKVIYFLDYLNLRKGSKKQ